MAIDSELDYTPLSTFSTMQFHNESVNILVSSLILTMILANLGSIISRAVSITGKDELCYKDWSRAFIFAHSDDPLKLISWLRGAYIFRNQSWRRLPNRVRLDRLVIPITARGILFIASLVSILVTFPSSTSMPGCVRADYALHMNKVQTNVRNDFEGLCKHIPLVSLGGHVASRASFCYTPMNQTNPLPANITDDLLEEDSNIIVAVVWNRRHATMEFRFINRNDFFGVAMFAEWSNPEGRSFRSDLSATIEPDTRLSLVLSALGDGGITCSSHVDSIFLPDFEVHAHALDCDSEFDEWAASGRAGLLFFSSATWVESAEFQPRYEIRGEIALPTTECPVVVTVVRPLINLIPLTVILLSSFVLNLCVSKALKNHGNVLDSVFHLVKEAVEGDCTSNVLEDSVEHSHRACLPLLKSLRGEYGHVGFLNASDERLVENFDRSVIVCNKSLDMQSTHCRKLCDDNDDSLPELYV